MTKTVSPLFLLTLYLLVVTILGEDEFIYKAPRQDSDNIYFAESFSSARALERFVPSSASKDGVDDVIAKYDGRWEVQPVETSSLQGDFSLVMKDKAKHHAIAARMKKTFKPGSKPLVFQYEVKFQTENPCGGAYVKLLSKDPNVDFRKFHDKTPYTIMFGPDRCGTQEKFHFILRHANPVTGAVEEKHAKKPDGFDKKYFEKGKTRLYRLVVHPDSSFEMSIDREVLSKGHLLSDVSPPLVPEEIIDDPNDIKPEDWDNREKIPDPEAVKPEDWDEDAPKQIKDSLAFKPEGWLDDEQSMVPDALAERPTDWDDEMDGEWEAPLVENPKCKDAPGCGPWSRPLVDNPDYKGKWRPALIDNPNYQGVWKPRKIPNPEYFEEKNPFERLTPIDAVGLELWTMSENVAFDNFILADDVGVVDRWTDETWAIKAAKEGAMAPSGPTILHQLFDAANERPWLWVVYIIGVLIPICILTMIFCPVKRETEGSRSEAADCLQQDQYDALPSESSSKNDEKEAKDKAAIRKKTDEPSPDVVDEEVEESVSPQRTPPVKAKRRSQESNDDAEPTTNGMANEEDDGIVNGVHDAKAKGKATLNGISMDEDEILRRSPRLRSKVRPRKE